MRTRFMAALAAAMALTGSAALAGDGDYRLAGYVELHGGGEAGTYEENAIDLPWWLVDEWAGFTFGGSGRAALWLDPFVIQIDAWVNVFGGEGEYCEDYEGEYCDDYWYWYPEGGIAKHVGFALSDDFTIAGMASLGFEDGWGIFATVAGEGVANLGNVRLLGQAGVTKAVYGWALEEDEAWGAYAHGVATFYATPDFSISGNLGANIFYDYDDTEHELVLGGRLEHKLGGLPVSGYIAGKAEFWEGYDDDEEWMGQEYTILAGIRFLAGGDTLQANDAAVPFIDLNPVYGDYPH